MGNAIYGGRRRGSAGAPADLDSAAQLLATDPQAALELARSLDLRSPGDPRVLLIMASAKRRLGEVSDAFKIIAPLATAYPRAAHTQYERGACLAALHRGREAEAALQTAVALNRDLAEAWRTLGDLRFERGDAAGADLAYAEHARAAVQDPLLKAAAQALFEGDFERVEREVGGVLAGRGETAAALQILATACARRSRHDDAERLLARALELEPGCDGVRFDYAEALFQQQKAVEALAQIESLLARDPAHPAYRNLIAACLGLVGEFERQGEIYSNLVADFPMQPKIWLNAAHALRTVGRGEESAAAYRRCIALAPGAGDAYWGLANLKVAPISPDETLAMLRLAAPGQVGDEDRLLLHYALGKALEDRGDDTLAFGHYAEGSRLRRARTPYSREETTAQTRRSRALFTPSFFAERTNVGSSSAAPIFIVGLPRAGSTLIEQMLASHSAIEGVMELPDIGHIARRLGRDGYPDGVAVLAADVFERLGDSYIASTQIHRKLDRPFFIDKMPNNFHHLGLIHLILPNARIIDARRHPMAAGFSVFKQHFAQGQSFSYDLTDIGRYYRDYVGLMRHFDEVLPGRVHRVIYEDLVEEPEREVRRLLTYCGLPFEPACLRFHENKRAVRTVSSEQVRRPIFRDGLDRWRRFAPWLGELEQALGPALTAWR